MAVLTLTSVRDLPAVAAARERLQQAREAHTQAEAQHLALHRILEPPPDTPRAGALEVVEARLAWPEAERAVLLTEIALQEATRGYEAARAEARRTVARELRGPQLALLRRLDRALWEAATVNEELQVFEEDAHTRLDRTNMDRQVLAWPHVSQERVVEWRRLLAQEGYPLDKEVRR